METMKDIEIEFEKFIKDQKEILEVGGCLNYVAISIWQDFLIDFVSDKYTKIHKYLEMLKKLQEEERF